uniref:Glycerol uptake facilitator n=1 Tax=Lactococcus lactis subsp. lactis TaxID=1360 RepID=A0A1V0P2F2_LACLL
MHSEMVQLLGEFLGTFILILLGNGVVSGVVLNKTKATGAGWVAITLGWGFAVMMGGLCFRIYVACPLESSSNNCNGNDWQL